MRFISSRRIKQVITKKLITDAYWGIKQTHDQMERRQERKCINKTFCIVLEAGHASCLVLQHHRNKCRSKKGCISQVTNHTKSRILCTRYTSAATRIWTVPTPAVREEIAPHIHCGFGVLIVPNFLKVPIDCAWATWSCCQISLLSNDTASHVFVS